MLEPLPVATHMFPLHASPHAYPSPLFPVKTLLSVPTQDWASYVYAMSYVPNPVATMKFSEATETTPDGPCAPDGPVGPRGPDGPVGPTPPVGPDGPVGPPESPFGP